MIKYKQKIIKYEQHLTMSDNILTLEIEHVRLSTVHSLNV